MKLHIAGDTHAPEIFRRAARHVGVTLCGITEAQLVIVAQDTPTDADGTRDVEHISYLTRGALAATTAPVVLTSQVEPGFTRRFDDVRLYHQAETLRIKDAYERALHPEQHIIGCMFPAAPLPLALVGWLAHFPAPVHQMTYEEAEFSKIAINVTLAVQVENASQLAGKAATYGCDWGRIKTVLQHDRRIGPHAYLEPGDWRESPHLLRDWKTLYG